jgi:hypothetical protein
MSTSGKESFSIFQPSKNCFEQHHPNIVLSLPSQWNFGIPMLSLKVSSSSVNTYLVIFSAFKRIQPHGLYQLEIQSKEYKAHAYLPF